MVNVGKYDVQTIPLENDIAREASRLKISAIIIMNELPDHDVTMTITIAEKNTHASIDYLSLSLSLSSSRSSLIVFLL